MRIEEHEIFPHRAADLRGARVLVLAPHPDDEVIACGGAIALHRRAGDAVRVVYVTSGEGGGWGGEAGDEVSPRREAEAGRALGLLEVDEWELWREPDRGVRADGALVERIADAVRRFAPTLLYAPSPLDLHPDHRAVAEALRHALRGHPGGLRVAFFEGGFASPVNVLVDVSAVWPVKEAALAAYASQAASPHDYRAAMAGLARFRALTLGRPATEAEGFHVTAAEEVERSLLWRWSPALVPATAAPAEPAISVVVRTRDRPAFLREALDSLAAQTLRDFEVVVVNDGGESPAAVVAEVPGLAVRIVELTERRGRGAASNAGVEAARGRFVAYLDDDDVYYPEHLSSLYAALEAHPHFAAAHADVHVGRYRRDPERNRYVLVERRVEHGRDFDPDRLLFWNQLPNLALMHRRDAWRAAGGFDESLELLEDWDFLVRLAAHVSFVHVPRVTAEYRVRDDGTNLSTERPWRGPDERRVREAIYRRYRDRRTPELELRVFERLHDRLAGLEAGGEALAGRVAELEAALGRRDAELASLRSRPAAPPAPPASADGAELARLHGEIERRERLIASMRATGTWRLRAAARRLLGRGA